MNTPLDILTAQLGAEQARAVLEVLNSAGWVVVPRVPTEAMLDAGWAGTWRDMIDAVAEKPES